MTAPYVYLDVHEVYFPSDLQAQLQNTYPASQDFAAITTGPSSNLNLDNLAQLDSIPGNCSFSNFDNCDVYLTSKTSPTSNPSYLYGTPPSRNLSTAGATSSAIIVRDHGDGTVDAFYMYFYAFNYGDVVLGQLLGNHVGDWEHTMLRFVNGQPVSMWFSIHDYGQAYTYDAVAKYGGRPIAYSALGSHGNHPVPGVFTRVIAGEDVDDYMSAGALWDPTLDAFYYTFDPSATPADQPAGSDAGILAGGGAFTAANSSDAPTSWLYFLGRWGDQQYPSTDPRQASLFNLTYEWVTGPTGPWDKQLVRNDVCPSAAGSSCVTSSVLPAVTTATSTAVISVPTSFPGLITNAIGSGTTGPATAVSTTVTGTAIAGGTATAGTTGGVSSSGSGSQASASPTSNAGSLRDGGERTRKYIVGAGIVGVLLLC